MNFFEHQARARRRTAWLIPLFGLAVAGLIAGLYLLVRGIVIWLGLTGAGVATVVDGPSYVLTATRWTQLWVWDAPTFAWVAFVTLLVVCLGSIVKTVQLQGGGTALALSLGARRIDRATRDPQERRLLNVVDEMAIASGIAAPPVFVLDGEPGINALAAGFTPMDAAIVVTHGALGLLTRDELQGVIAHEFSHVLNGDMRLNLRLIGLIHGILIIGLSGQVILRALSSPHGPRIRLSGRGSGSLVVAAAAIGACLAVLGYLGVLFGNLIKAAVSRQREFLADASAVQFTRQPGGLVGALKKIGGLPASSRLLDPRSAVASHMLFGQGFARGLSDLLSTHPPLRERIRRLEPTFDGIFPVVAPAATASVEPSTAAIAPLAPPAPFTPRQAGPAATSPSDPMAQIGRPSAEHLTYARTLLDGLPSVLREAAHEPYGAQALIYALLLSPKEKVRREQTEKLAAGVEPEIHHETVRLADAIAPIDRAAWLPLIDLTIPTLRQLSSRQYTSFRARVRELIETDLHTDFFEWMLQHVLLRHLDASFRPSRPRAVQYDSLRGLGDACSTVLSALAWQAQQEQAVAQAAFAHGAAAMPSLQLALLARERCTTTALDYALDSLARASLPAKQTLLKACVACVLTDNRVSVEELEMLRGVADSLGCPMPPLVAAPSIAMPARVASTG